jgi:hypothetical protein
MSKQDEKETRDDVPSGASAQWRRLAPTTVTRIHTCCAGRDCYEEQV